MIRTIGGVLYKEIYEFPRDGVLMVNLTSFRDYFPSFWVTATALMRSGVHALERSFNNRLF
jgi:hypothetical protein